MTDTSKLTDTGTSFFAIALAIVQEGDLALIHFNGDAIALKDVTAQSGFDGIISGTTAQGETIHIALASIMAVTERAPPGPARVRAF